MKEAMKKSKNRMIKRNEKIINRIIRKRIKESIKNCRQYACFWLDYHMQQPEFEKIINQKIIELRSLGYKVNYMDDVYKLIIEW